MPTARFRVSVASGPDGRIYAVGGNSGNGTSLSTAEVFDPFQNRWFGLPAMPTPREGLGLTAGFDGFVYAIGGWDGVNPTGKVEAYNAAGGFWLPATAMPTPRQLLAVATSTDGHIYAFGGVGASLLNTTEVLDTSTGTWATAAPMPTPRFQHAATTGLDGKIYVVGGYNVGSILNTLEVYTPWTNTWATLANMPTARGGLTAVTAADGRIFAIGGSGSNGSGLPTVEVYNPSTNTWAAGAPLPTARFWLGGAVANGGRIYAIGGCCDGTGSGLSTVEVYGVPGGRGRDLNGDGIDDLLLQNSISTAVGAWLMDANGHPAAFLPVNSSFIGPWKVVGHADINSDGIADIVLQDSSSSWVAAWLIDGTGHPVTFLPIYSSNIGAWKVVGTLDLNHDGITDILLQNTSTTLVGAWLMDGAGHAVTFLPVYSNTISTWTVVATGDMNSDGIDDIILQDTNSTWVGAWLMDGAGHTVSFVPIYSANVATWRVVGTLDLNRDGKTDIILQDGFSTWVGAWLMDGAGHTAAFVQVNSGDIGAWKVNGKY